ncbi:hypothetical protein [Mucilaginibacter sp. L3T2-6]|uniref:hypothetical protein n=1 Tax=Mucilaginibacter sp. L3T2-6 TaxID=3062491 RepID=UPI002677247E|nr:hypothetical protein [Mucilaginibacter sp. L3T2-6]MDO3644231.1 hypothetical protein [Mucilaginibacter sp. L3T2-6]MDV6216672.1 hypothetical protein [Mucilaginibacter sp. L3T2-6]
MKKSKLLLAGLVTIVALLANAPVKAAGTSQTTAQSTSLWDGLSDWWSSWFGGSGSGTGSSSGSGSTGSTGASGTSSGGTSLPVNGGLWMLVAAGAIVGTKAIMYKNTETATQKA